MDSCDYETSIERWAFIEITIEGPSQGNPFVEQSIEGVFTCKNETKKV